jgi:hypothetical protein
MEEEKRHKDVLVEADFVLVVSFLIYYRQIALDKQNTLVQTGWTMRETPNYTLET